MGFGRSFGIATNPLSTSLIAADVAVQPDGKIVAVNAKFGVARFRANGTAVDSAFGTGGMAIVTVTGSAERCLVETGSQFRATARSWSRAPVTFAIDPPLAAPTASWCCSRDSMPTRCARRHVRGLRASTEQRSRAAVRARAPSRTARPSLAGSVDIPRFRSDGWSRETPRVHVHVPPAPASGLQDRDRAPLAGLAGSLRPPPSQRRRKEQWAWQKGPTSRSRTSVIPIGGDHTGAVFL